MAGGQIRRPGGHCRRPALLARVPHGAAVCAAVHGAPGAGQHSPAGEMHPSLLYTLCIPQEPKLKQVFGLGQKLNASLATPAKCIARFDT